MIKYNCKYLIISFLDAVSASGMCQMFAVMSRCNRFALLPFRFLTTGYCITKIFPM